MNTDDFIHPVVMVLILKVKKLAQPKCRLIRKSTPLPQIGYPKGFQGYGISGLPMATQAPTHSLSFHSQSSFPIFQLK